MFAILSLIAVPTAEALMPHIKCIGCTEVTLEATIDRAGQLDLTLDGESLSDWGDGVEITTDEPGEFDLVITDAVDAQGRTWEVAVVPTSRGVRWEEVRGGVAAALPGDVEQKLSVQVVATAADGSKIKYGPVITVKPKG